MNHTKKMNSCLFVFWQPNKIAFCVVKFEAWSWLPIDDRVVEFVNAAACQQPVVLLSKQSFSETS